jgi:hypothetical protein
LGFAVVFNFVLVGLKTEVEYYDIEGVRDGRAASDGSAVGIWGVLDTRCVGRLIPLGVKE